MRGARRARPNPEVPLPLSLHRGPNQQGVFESECRVAGRRLGSRSSTSHGGDQPIATSDAATPSSSSTARSTTTRNCGGNSNSAGHRFRSAQRHRDGAACVPASGTRRVSRGCAACSAWRCGRESRTPPGSGARPHGHQAALYRAARRRPVLRLGAEGDFGSSRDRAVAQPRRVSIAIFR